MATHVLPPSAFVTYLQTIARNKATEMREFVWATNCVNRVLLEYALSQMAYEQREIETPTGAIFNGLQMSRPIQAVSIIRAGESLEVPLREILPGAPIGKILIQRNKETLQPKLYYEKLPANIANSTVLLFEPMLATGRSLALGVQRLLNAGVQENHIICVNYLASPRGIEKVQKQFPSCSFVVASVEDALTDEGYMVPGIGDFGDRYFDQQSLHH